MACGAVVARRKRFELCSQSRDCTRRIYGQIDVIQVLETDRESKLQCDGNDLIVPF